MPSSSRAMKRSQAGSKNSSSAAYTSAVGMAGGSASGYSPAGGAIAQVLHQSAGGFRGQAAVHRADGCLGVPGAGAVPTTSSVKRERLGVGWGRGGEGGDQGQNSKAKGEYGASPGHCAARYSVGYGTHPLRIRDLGIVANYTVATASRKAADVLNASARLSSAG